MTILNRFRFSMGSLLMFVLMAAIASALFVKIRHYSEAITQVGWKIDAPSLFLIGIALTAVALAAWKDHSGFQVMMQVCLTCLGCLTFLWIAEGKHDRAVRYWFQASFAVMVTLPMLGRMYIRRTMPRSPIRKWWKKTFEAMFFSWLTLMLLSLGGLVQGLLYFTAYAIMTK
jgi:hypothetical protein